ncbi:molybdopterin synthase catalytic subunit MoaE [Motilimonas sp. 1_MG-2023]|uniref:molybdopterin synthase catalytic subunit MoaE n=1 Tax=Motilimonas sp. 1_MG-2023 TaxID=3062672 RepID=UPI0026E16157|nr:molybdopterin synthase catalytic subunit MoaE [Motilimonas sp. 1_MG-2023]MDO6526513.1 molybdopterin synthase catalytic subunit MoaE [Motilimonas sp. 1_MG-2023]
MIRVQTQDFDINHEYKLLASKSEAGAIVTFVGLVREMNLAKKVTALHLEHYPEMTEKSLRNIVQQAKQRWDLIDVTLIHRVGTLGLNQQIVFVGVSSQHRGQAFAACEFIMDFLKTQAPFWKKEHSESGELWLDANDKDMAAAKRWQR